MSRAAQLILPAIRWDRDRGFAGEETAIERALSLGVGGFILFGGEREEVRRLTGELRTASRHPLLIASDLERGAGQQFRGLTPLPPAAALAEMGEDAVRSAARMTADEARDVGVNWVLAPVADLDIEAANPIVQTRSFGSDPAAVANAAAAWVASCQAKGVLACAKHFPGHGRTTVDSHAELPVVAAGRDELESDILPFRSTVSAGVASVMTAHVAYPSLGGGGRPATRSPRIVSVLLRDRLRFDGLVVTDALIMAGASEPGLEAAAAREAVEAGCDLLLYPGEPEAVMSALERGLAESAEPLSGNMERALERRYRAASEAATQRSLDDPALAANLAFGERMSLAAVRPLRGEPPRARGGFTVDIVDDDAGGPYPLPPRTAFSERLESLGVETGGGDERIVLLFADVKSWKGRAGLSAESGDRLARLIDRPATVVLFGHPRRLSEIPGDCPVLCAWSGDTSMQHAAARRLTG